jgi:hypothetical protein
VILYLCGCPQLWKGVVSFFSGVSTVRSCFCFGVPVLWDSLCVVGCVEALCSYVNCQVTLVFVAGLGSQRFISVEVRIKSEKSFTNI